MTEDRAVFIDTNVLVYAAVEDSPLSPACMPSHRGLLRLLRDHGLIRKLPRQKRYLVTHKGHKLTAALNALLAASTKQLMDIAA